MGLIPNPNTGRRLSISNMPKLKRQPVKDDDRNREYDFKQTGERVDSAYDQIETYPHERQNDGPGGVPSSKRPVTSAIVLTS